MTGEQPSSEDNAAELERASQGDVAASERVLSRWSPVIERYLRRRAARKVLERESAADLAQSVCREALERMRRGDLVYQGDAALEHWLFGAADLKVKNRLRHLAADKRAPDPVGRGDADGAFIEELAQDPAGTPSAAIARGEDEASFRAALAQLDERQRLCVQLFHFEGLSHAALAERLGVTESHSRTLLARALARLARVLREGGPSAG